MFPENVYEHMCGAGLTPRDNDKTVRILRAGRCSNEYDLAKDAVKKARRSWLTYLITNQRHWQRKPKTRARARARIYHYTLYGSLEGKQRKEYVSRRVSEELAVRDKYVRGS